MEGKRTGKTLVTLKELHEEVVRNLMAGLRQNRCWDVRGGYRASFLKSFWIDADYNDLVENIDWSYRKFGRRVEKAGAEPATFKSSLKKSSFNVGCFPFSKRLPGEPVKLNSEHSDEKLPETLLIALESG